MLARGLAAGPLRHPNHNPNPNPFIEKVVMIPAAMSEQHWGVGVAWQNGLHCPTTFLAWPLGSREHGTGAEKREWGERRISRRIVSDLYHFAPGGEKAEKRTKAQLAVRLVQGTSIHGRAWASLVAGASPSGDPPDRQSDPSRSEGRQWAHRKPAQQELPPPWIHQIDKVTLRGAKGKPVTRCQMLTINAAERWLGRTAIQRVRST